MLLEKYRSSSNLAAAGATLTREPDGQRIIAGQVVELLTLSSSGAFMVLTDRSSAIHS